MVNKTVNDDNGLANPRTIDAFFEAENKPYLAWTSEPRNPFALCANLGCCPMRLNTFLTRHSGGNDEMRMDSAMDSAYVAWLEANMTPIEYNII